MSRKIPHFLENINGRSIWQLFDRQNNCVGIRIYEEEFDQNDNEGSPPVCGYISRTFHAASMLRDGILMSAHNACEMYDNWQDVKDAF